MFPLVFILAKVANLRDSLLPVRLTIARSSGITQKKIMITII